MLPAQTWLEAARRWLPLLQRSSPSQAWQLIRSDSSYTDISVTQYMSGLDLLTDLGLLIPESTGQRVAGIVLDTPEEALSALLFRETLRIHDPAWLPDVDVLVPDVDDLPIDAVDLANTLGVTSVAALVAVRQLHGKLDLAARAEVGAAGERAVVQLLRERGLEDVRHVALTDDGLGYDVELGALGRRWHLEVKTTATPSRLRFYLSRHEFEVARVDPQWLLVIVVLDGQRAPECWSVEPAYLWAQAPRDGGARWESARFSPTSTDVASGIRLGDVTVLGG